MSSLDPYLARLEVWLAELRLAWMRERLTRMPCHLLM
jgi:hypothetical protein